MPDNNVRLQNLRDFTVQIRDADGQIVGTGIAVSMDGKIVTCRHVVEAVGIDPCNANGAEVGIYFPQVRGGEEKKRRAKVDCCFQEYEDDMVLLQLIEGTSPLAPEQIAVLGTADQSEGNPFRTYGYSPIGNYPATRGDGFILGTVEAPVDRNLQVDPVQLKSRDVAAGMSGAAVLDVTRNLVVGLVAERFYPTGAVQDDIGYGVDSKVLTFSPFDFVLSQDDLALKPAPEFRLDKDLFKQAMDIANYMLAHRPAADKYSWNSAPSSLPEWTGRNDLLAQITEDWKDPQKHVTGLIGFGGEGKSSLARKWVGDVIASERTLRARQSPVGEEIASTEEHRLAMTLDGVFWWGFYENRSVDEFLEAALNYLSGGKIDPRQVPSSSLRAQIIGAMLGAGRYLFVLDGLEVLQHQEGDQYGLLQSNDLRDLLTYFARPDNQSFCLITSRAPLLDLMDYTTYTHRDVDRLSEDDGRALLRRLGVNGVDTQLDKVVSDWDGHALTISLLGSYLAEKYNGDIAHLADIPIPTADEPRYERVHRVLWRYDEHLTQPEREFLKLFSAFRTPVHESAFEKVFVPLLNKPAQTDSPITNYQITNLVTRLVTYRILHRDVASQTYTAHPLVRNHYLAILTHGDSKEQHDVHGKIKDYYLSLAGDMPQLLTLDDLKPLIEVVHHACQAGAYDEAYQVFKHRIDQGRWVLTNQLGAYSTQVELLLQFFPNGDCLKDPQVSNPKDKFFIINDIGYCFMCLGYIDDAHYCYSSAIGRYLVTYLNYHANSLDVIVVYENLAAVYIYLGRLQDSTDAISKALGFSNVIRDQHTYLFLLSWQAWIENLKGSLNKAEEIFIHALNVERKIDPSINYLYALRGIQYAKFLFRIGKGGDALNVTEENLRICNKYNWLYLISGYHSLLGEIYVAWKEYELARNHLNESIKIARSIARHDTLIEALLARGRFFAKSVVGVGLSRHNNARPDSGDPPVQDAFNDLNEALNYAVEGGYRIYEADIRVALGWAYLANGEKGKAKESAERALQMSQEMGYHWGKVDAEEVLEKIRE